MPAPLLPADVDLRGLPFMPLDTVRLLDSDLFALSSGDEFKAAVALWCKSWTQVPAASVPNDDRVLAHLSGAGARWKKVMPMALRGWILCDDGRWYHPVVAEKALEAWSHRTAQRARANKRWHGTVPPSGNAAASTTADADASAPADATAMQGTGTGTGTVKKKRAERATRLPADWTLPEEWAAWAKAERPELDPHAVAAKFADHWHAKPGAAGTKLDWLATWRNWIREERAAKVNGVSTTLQRDVWWSSDAGIARKCADLGIDGPRRGESTDQVKGRINEAMTHAA